MNNKVLVLLSTYNGEKYLQEQLVSVIEQDGVDVSVLIRDDGSSDSTVAVIQEMQKKFSNIKLIKDKNCGCAFSFMSLIYEACCNYGEYDYYAFCDQDDVWLPNKLKAAVNELNKITSDKAGLYLGAYQMVDSNLNKIHTLTQNPSLDIVSAFVSNPATGCTMVFNKKLLNIVAEKKPSFIIMHDYWTYLVCLSAGGYVCYDKTPYILYRQHDRNVIGGIKDSFLKRWSVRIKKTIRKGDYYKSRTANQLLECYGDIIAEKDKLFIKQVSNCKSFKSKLSLLFNRRFKANSLDKNLQLLGLIITGKL